jgi:CO/xanthine dehydrogenase FAD-binding subunit
VRYARVNTERELLDRLGEEGAVILCGGTDLLVKMHAQWICPQLLVDVSELESLHGIDEVDGCIDIGAATTMTDLLNSSLIRRCLPLLPVVLAKLGSVQIRNRGTLGGNLVNASPAADTAIPLLLFDAGVVVVGPNGERTIAVEKLFVGPGRTSMQDGEFVRRVRIPVPDRPFRTFYHKIGKRRALTIAIASLGALIHTEDSRIVEARFAAGSVAPTPLRLRSVEQQLVNAEVTEGTVERARAIAADSVSPIDDIRGTAIYRRAVIGDLVVRAVHEVCERE